MALEVERGPTSRIEAQAEPEEGPRGTHASKSPGAGTSNRGRPNTGSERGSGCPGSRRTDRGFDDLSTVRGIIDAPWRKLVAVDRGLASWKLTPLISGTVLGKLSLTGKPPPPAIGLLLAPLS